jgi:hypothetical protein
MRTRLALGFLLALATAGCDTLTDPRIGTSGEIAPVASLALLTVSAGTLSPTFKPDTTTYSLPLANDITSLTVTPTAASADQIITVNGGPVASGAQSPAISVPVGPSSVVIRVTTPDGFSVQVYTIGVSRAF